MELAAHKDVRSIRAGFDPTVTDLASILDTHYPGSTDKCEFAHRGHAAVAIAVALDVVEQLARLALKPRGERTAVGHEQLVAVDQQISLRRQSRFVQRVMVNTHLRQVVAVVVHPQRLARLGIDRDDKYTQRWPDPSAKVDDSVGQYGRAANGPVGDQAVVAQMLVLGPILRCPADFP